GRRDPRPARQPAEARPDRLVRVTSISERLLPLRSLTARDLLYLDVHGSRRQAVPRHRDDRNDASLLLLSDAAIHLLRHPDVGARRRARDDWLDDEEQRA